MDDAATGKVNKDGHITVAFTDTELVNAKGRDLGDRDGPVHSCQFEFVDILDHVPANTEDGSNILNGHVFKHIQHIEGKGPDKAVIAKHELGGFYSLRHSHF